MNNFDFCSPTRFVFGKDTEKQAGSLLKEYGATKVLLHSGGGSIKKSGLYNRVTESLDNAGIPFVALDGVRPNPRSSLVYEGIALCRKEKVDFILAVGGGSVIDSAKAIAVGTANTCDFLDFFEEKEKLEKSLPVATIVTIAAAGSEGSTSCVITNERTGKKSGINHNCLRPIFSIMNPELTYTLEPFQTACGIADIISHTLERYISNTREVSLSDRLCEALLLTLIQNAPIVMSNPNDYGARANIMWAGTLAHNHIVGLGRQEDWTAHAIEHVLSAEYDIAHGAGLAVVFPAYITYQYKHNVLLFAHLFERIFALMPNRDRPEETVVEGINCLVRFFTSLGLPSCFEELGIPKEDIPHLASKVKVNAQGFASPFYPITIKDIENIYILCCK